MNGIAPGPVKTNMMWHEGDSLIMPSHANGRIGMPKEIAELILLYAGDLAMATSGRIVLCDGGEVLK